MQPELLYLKDQPYTRLYIEVDAIEGVEVPQEWLDELEAFFVEHCCKPDGIAIVRDEPIPLSEVKDLTVTEAALLYTDGPPVDDGEQPAYLHVCFYDLHEGLSAMSKSPHVPVYCPTTIFYNVDYGRHLPDRTHMDWLRHEAGHILGLGRNRDHGDGEHCRNYNCLMRPGTENLTALARTLGTPFGIKFAPRPLCTDCLRDIELLKATDVSQNLSFQGPFLVRRENGYAIVRLPQCDFIAMDDTGPRDWRDTLERAKKAEGRMIVGRRKGSKTSADEGTQTTPETPAQRAPKKGRGFMVFSVLGPSDKEAYPLTQDQFVALLAAAAEDPCPLIRSLIRHVREKMAVKDATP